MVRHTIIFDNFIKLVSLLSKCPTKNPPQNYRSQCNTIIASKCASVSAVLPPTCKAKCDSAASYHYWRDEDMPVTKNVTASQGRPVTLPDNSTLVPAKKCTIPLGPAFSATAKEAKNLPHFKSASLVAVGPICDDNKLAIFDDKKVLAVEHNRAL